MKNQYEVCGDIVKIRIQQRGRTFDAIIDASDLPLVQSYPGRFYARGRGDREPYVLISGPRMLSLHRIVMGVEGRDGLVIDHINRHPLDNRRSNLRWVTQKENVRNTERCDRTITDDYVQLNVRIPVPIGDAIRIAAKEEHKSIGRLCEEIIAAEIVKRVSQEQENAH